jgi:hypothetical protein
MGEQATFYISSAFVLAYGTGTLHMPRNFLLRAFLTAAAISIFHDPVRRTSLRPLRPQAHIYMLGAVLTGAYGFAYFALLDTRVPALVYLAIALSLVVHDVMYGPRVALITESFGARVRICAEISLVSTATLCDYTNRDPAD